MHVVKPSSHAQLRSYPTSHENSTSHTVLDLGSPLVHGTLRAFISIEADVYLDATPHVDSVSFFIPGHCVKFVLLPYDIAHRNRLGN